MALRIEDYALIGDCHTGALVGSNGSIDWLCLPRFDSPSTFGALLGTRDEGHWLLAPLEAIESPGSARSTRAYLPDSFVLITKWVTSTGEVEVTDLMPLGDRRADVIRRVRGISGTVRMMQELRIRFDYSAAVPWIRQMPEHGENAVVAVAGPDAVVIRGPHLEPTDHVHSSHFDVGAGETVDMTMTWYPAHRTPPAPIDVDKRIEETLARWREWAANCTAAHEYEEQVHRSLLVLRALTHEDTGGIVAAVTTSLPEDFGGVRNWDYRYVWLRDASLTLNVLLSHGFRQEATEWRGWLLRAIAGDPADVQIMYGLSGERRLQEWKVGSLPGYESSSPVRAGNDAYRQYQGDIFGHAMLALQEARTVGLDEDEFSWPLQKALLGFLEQHWRRADHGIWEIRGPERHFTHSRVMIWAAFDCGIRAVTEHGLDGPVDRWRHLRDEIAAEIESQGFDSDRGTYTQFYGSSGVDASLLQLPQTGYLAADDPRMLGTVAAIEKELLRDGLLLRYRTETTDDGLPAGEHPFLACSFWLVEQYAASGRLADARTLMNRLVGFCNDVGLLSEEYDVTDARQAGNTPQALSHLTLVRAADAIDRASAREMATAAQ